MICGGASFGLRQVLCFKHMCLFVGPIREGEVENIGVREVSEKVRGDGMETQVLESGSLKGKVPLPLWWGKEKMDVRRGR